MGGHPMPARFFWHSACAPVSGARPMAPHAIGHTACANLTVGLNTAPATLRGSSNEAALRRVVVAAGALMGCVAIGTVFSLAVFLQPMSAATGWSRTGISGAMTIVFVTMGLGAFGWGALTDRFGPMIVVLSGGVLLGVGLALASRATSLLEFQLIYGVIVGGSAGAVFVPTIATVTGWFDNTHRSLAVSLVSAGMGVAPMTISPFASWLISTYETGAPHSSASRSSPGHTPIRWTLPSRCAASGFEN